MPSLSPTATRAIDSWKQIPTPLRLACGVQHYAWGQRGEAAFIPRLLGVAPDSLQPYAELWIGAHPMLPAYVSIDGTTLRLDELVAVAPETILGPRTIEAFGPELPFLMKVLAAAQPLSIQAHPTRAQAQAGFAREEAAGITLSAPNRSYRDRNHKPELIVALTPFYALEGFRPPAEITAALAGTPELAFLLEAAPPGPDARAWLRRLFETGMAREAAQVGRGLAQLVARLEEEARARPLPPEDARHWFLRAARELSDPARPDRGLLAFFLLNFVSLAPGQALFLGPGELHAYLQGVGVEVMASSDNVLRGGLTPKHVDLPELLRVLTFRPSPPEILAPRADGVYPTPAPEFETTAVTLDAGARLRVEPQGPVVLLALEGRAVVEGGPRSMPIRRGEALLIPAALDACAIVATDGAARFFLASVPRDGRPSP